MSECEVRYNDCNLKQVPEQRKRGHEKRCKRIDAKLDYRAKQSV